MPRDLGVPRGPNSRDPSVRVIHSVGSDTVIGKKVVTLELDLEARRRGLRSVYVPTGQTGVAIAGWGIAVDHVISDYVAGAADDSSTRAPSAATCSSSRAGGALSYSGVTLGLLHGCAPDLLVLVHRAGATALRNHADLPLPTLPELIAAYEAVARPVRPATVAAVALNTAGLSEREARAALAAAAESTGLVSDDVVRFGAAAARRSARRRRLDLKSSPRRKIWTLGPGAQGAIGDHPHRGRVSPLSRCSLEEAHPDVGASKLRRYRLARVAVSPRSALGVDRHERLEQVAARRVLAAISAVATAR